MNEVSAVVLPTLRLRLDGPTTVVATAGVAAPAAPSATVRANVQWRLEISAATPEWTPVDSLARTDKPASDLQWSTSDVAGYAPLSTAPAIAAQGGATAGQAVPLRYRVRFDKKNDAHGSYSMVVRYTLTTS